MSWLKAYLKQNKIKWKLCVLVKKLTNSNITFNTVCRMSAALKNYQQQHLFRYISAQLVLASKL